MVTNGLCLIALWLHYRHKKERCQVFFNFFFVGCSGVGARVWVWGARVGMGAGWIERAEDGAGWIGIDAFGWTESASLASPICRSG